MFLLHTSIFRSGVPQIASSTAWCRSKMAKQALEPHSMASSLGAQLSLWKRLTHWKGDLRCATIPLHLHTHHRRQTDARL